MICRRRHQEERGCCKKYCIVSGLHRLIVFDRDRFLNEGAMDVSFRFTGCANCVERKFGELAIKMVSFWRRNRELYWTVGPGGH